MFTKHEKNLKHFSRQLSHWNNNRNSTAAHKKKTQQTLFSCSWKCNNIIVASISVNFTPCAVLPKNNWYVNPHRPVNVISAPHELMRSSKTISNTQTKSSFPTELSTRCLIASLTHSLTLSAAYLSHVSFVSVCLTQRQEKKLLTVQNCISAYRYVDRPISSCCAPHCVTELSLTLSL